MSEKNMGRLAQDMKREIIAIISRLKDPAARRRPADRHPAGRDARPGCGKGLCQRAGQPRRPAPVIQALNHSAGHVRTELSRKMHIRKAPRLIFVEDDGAAYAAHINELLKELNVDGGEPAAETDGE